MVYDSMTGRAQATGLEHLPLQISFKLKSLCVHTSELNLFSTRCMSSKIVLTTFRRASRVRVVWATAKKTMLLYPSDKAHCLGEKDANPRVKPYY